VRLRALLYDIHGNLPALEAVLADASDADEFVLGGDPAGGPVSALSVDIGCVRLTERYLHSDPPAAAEIAAAVNDIGAALDRVAGALPVRAARTLVGLAGSVTTVAALALGLPHYDAAQIHHARISARQVAEQGEDIAGKPYAGDPSHEPNPLLGPLAEAPFHEEKFDDLEKVFATEGKKNAKLVVLVKIDRLVKYRFMVGLIDQLQFAELNRFSLAPLEPKEKQEVEVL